MSNATQQDESFTSAQRAYDAQEAPFVEGFTGDAEYVEVRVDLEDTKPILFLAACGLGIPADVICWALARNRAEDSDRNPFDEISAELGTSSCCAVQFYGDLQVDDGRAYKFAVHSVENIDASQDVGITVTIPLHGGDAANKLIGEWLCEYINDHDLVDDVVKGGSQ